MLRMLRIMAGLVLIAILTSCDYGMPGGAPGSAGRNTPGDNSPSDQGTGNFQPQGEGNSQEAAAEDSGRVGPEPTITPANPNTTAVPFVDGTGGESNSGRLAGKATTGSAGGGTTGQAGTSGGVTDDKRTVPSPSQTIDVRISAQGAIEPQQVTTQAGGLVQVNFYNDSADEIIAIFEFDRDSGNLPLLTFPTPATVARPDDGQTRPNSAVGAGVNSATVSSDSVGITPGSTSTVYLQQDAPAQLQVRFAKRVGGQALTNGMTIVVK